MAFVPTISFCLEQDANDNYQLHVNDTTDVYDATDNTTGWEDASTLLAANVVTATLAVTDPSGTTTTINVLSQIPDPVTGQLDFTALDASDGVSIKDGYYKVLYTLNDGSTDYTACVEKYFYPVVKCCISKVVNKLVDDPSNEKIQDDLNKIKAYEAVLCAAAQAGDKTTADKFLALLQVFCTYNECNCY